MTPAQQARAGIAAAFVAGIAVAVIAGMTKPEPVKPKPQPTEKPSMQWFLDANGPNGTQSSTDLQSLGKYGPEHDKWILQKYAPPKAKPKPAGTRRAAPESKDG